MTKAVACLDIGQDNNLYVLSVHAICVPQLASTTKAQLCGHDPSTMVAAARMVEQNVDAVDINLGCPENIAKKGR